MTDDETCPICGKPYDHRYTNTSPRDEVSIRGDAMTCSRESSALLGNVQFVYVHFPKEMNAPTEFG